MSNNEQNESTWKIPSLEEIEKQKATSSKPKTLFFKSKQSANTTNQDSSTPHAAVTATNATTGAAQNKVITNITQQNNKPNYRRTVGNTILVSPNQQKNPVLKFIRNVPYEPSESIKVDYVVGQTTGVIYLSLRYHRLYPTYIYDRLNNVKHLERDQSDSDPE
ncbi:hypothetical protein RO3G_08599 [Rhizopus delemar RA 99-880]|uniref:ERCC1-like central domain-containing protein n=1 Tax=Rhizopus delemar (strain RA 99-880 / ATCC MYA-4621 / FGSC 9543 / NRRL 43880) TaxID=246409 RepID=I1C614_RHIO9|nr:hypothetical protein RO3G_08599 [Rhizopus delemar RA 99-880]|eukprot:EIE83894.1 hypothetical protein RO3G_08599 [Rhizopus delemar RA 99-880]